MSPELIEQYEDAMKRLDPHIKQRADGTFEIEPHNEVIDPIILADFTRSIEVTNDMIIRGDLDPRKIVYGQSAVSSSSP